MDDHAAGLTIEILGPPRIRRAGVPLEVDTQKAIAIVAYLAIADQPVRREALAALLWSEHDADHARGALRRTLSVLRSGLDGGWLEVDRAAVSLSPLDRWVDVERFRSLIAAADSHEHEPGPACTLCVELLSEAALLHRGDFLAGFALRDSVAFDDWQAFEAEGLRRDLAKCLERLTDLLAAQGRFDEALEQTRRWLSLDPLHEAAHRKLMRLHAWSGDRSAALRQYREAVRILDAELGVTPLDETTDLYRAIQEARMPLGGSRAASEGCTDGPAPRRPVERPVAYPLAGRDRELGELLVAYQASRGGRRLAVIEGEPGVGKTRLAQEMAARARAIGGPVLTGASHEGEANLPYGLVDELLRGALFRQVEPGWLNSLPKTWLSELARLLPELGERVPRLPAGGPPESPGAQVRLFEAISRVLQAALEGPSPGLVILDDVQWADAASMDALAYLIRRTADRSICVVMVLRTEEVPVDHLARRLSRELGRGGRASTVSLGRLSRGAVASLVRSASVSAEDRGPEGSRPGDLAERLYEETEGLPIFIVEYLAAIRASGAEGGSGSWPMPQGVRDLVQLRLRSVGETARQILAAAAAIGRSFSFETVRSVSGRTDDETVDALEELVEAGLIQEGPDDGSGPRFDFRHEKVRAVAGESTSLTRRRILHTRIASVLERGDHSSPRVDRPWALIGEHRRLAGLGAEAAEAFRRAGDEARRLYANAEALSYYEKALGLGYPDGAILHESIGDLQTLGGEYGAALASYEAAASLAMPAGLARLEHKLGVLHLRLGSADVADAHLEAAESGTADLALLSRIRVDRSLAAHRHGESDKALQLATAALETAESSSNPSAIAGAHNVLGLLATRGGDVAGARAHLERGLELAGAAGDLSLRIAVLNNMALAHAANRDLRRAIGLTEEALALCVTQGDRHREAALHNNLADLLHADGRADQAMEHLKAAVAIFAEVGEPGVMRPEIWQLVDW